MMFRSHLSRAASGRRKQPWYVGSNGVSGGGQTVTLTGLSGGYWTELAQNDLVVVASICSNSAQTPSITTSGYTQIVDESLTSLRLIICYKVMGSTPDTSVAVANTDNETVRAWCFRGVNTTTPIDATTVIAKNTNTAMDNAAITTVTDASIVLAIGASLTRKTGLPHPSSPTNPAGMVTLADSSTTFDDGDEIFYRATIDASYIAQGKAGAYNPAAWTSTTQVMRWICATVALRPA